MRLLLLTNSARNFGHAEKLRSAGLLAPGQHEVWYIREFHQDPAPADGPNWTAVSDLEDTGQLRAALTKAIAHSGQPDRVLALDEFGVLPAAWLRDMLDLPGAREPELLPLRDKRCMHERAASAGLRTTRRLSAAELRGWDFGTPLVVKPRREAASIGVRRIDSPAELDGALADSPDPVIEEWVDGEVCHVDGVAMDGHIEYAGVARYLGSCYDFATGAGMSGCTVREPAVRERLLGAAREVVRGLRIPDGAFHIELFDVPGGPILLEAAARPPGALLQMMGRAATGVDLLAEHIRAGIGVPQAIRPTRNAVAGYWRLPQRPPGGDPEHVGSVPALPELRCEIVHAQLPRVGELASGQPCPSEPLAAVVVRAQDEAAVLADLMTLRDELRVTFETTVRSS